ncbi:alpha beta superfamily hydrolase [Companilactobacillus tucceti DSM 20183]|uniref:Alpha beta superfamily hydrolase n=1 Tax=Companilactobacillus tucceti DSM 20183 TaxID=1423811 RepID=A0A0R1J1T2_9LACO|nr:alpha/beta hydrolase [Companilactobacillus tucceti]KRK65192.1 alpha beta superfamily hydrolase [Companilactobacillus tucceti DSM 20183]
MANTSAIRVKTEDEYYIFKLDNSVIREHVYYKTRYDIEIAADLYYSKSIDKDDKYPAIVVGPPFGGVKEQGPGVYANQLAQRGFVVIAFDPAYHGYSGGMPRYSGSPDTYVEDFSAAVDYLGLLSFVDRNRIGVLGICASGGFALNEAKVDSRFKAITTVSSTDMGAVARGIRDSMGDSNWIDEASNQRTAEKAGADTIYTSGTPEKIDENSDAFSKEIYDFYRTQRGAANTTTKPTLTSFVKLLNFYSLSDIETVSPRPLLFIAGENAISLGFSEDAYKAAKEPKELYKVKNAGHVDLYDRTDLIPFEKLNDFFKSNLK